MKKLRKNCFNGVIDVKDVTRAYAVEFYRIFEYFFSDISYFNIKLLDKSKKFITILKIY